MPIPVVGLAGFSNSGKTTLLEKIIAVLDGRGYQVGVIKHTHHQIEFDQPGKDTWRHAKAGAEVVVLASAEGISLYKRLSADPSPEVVLDMISGVDLIIVEGYKWGNWPKIALLRQEVAERADIPKEELLAVVSDMHKSHSESSDIPCFDWNDFMGIANLIEREIIGKREDR